MSNSDLAKQFYDIADILDILGVPWKPIAYRKAARNIESTKDDLADILRKGGINALKEIPALGDAIAKKSIEYIETGKIKELEILKKKLPKGLTTLLNIRGVGPKRARILWKRLKITTIDQLEKACKENKIRNIQGFGAKSEEDILSSINIFRKGQSRYSIGIARPIAREIVNELKKLKSVEKIEIGGSVRRMKETCKDIDILVVSNKPEEVIQKFTSLKNIEKITGKGTTKSSIILKNGMPVDIRVVKKESFGSSLQYFTGNKEHNVRTRQIALRKGMTLSEYGLFNLKTKKYIAGEKEQDIYKTLNLQYPAPELRENSGELEADSLPNLISYNSIKGDLHCHTTHSDGSMSAEEMLREAENKGYEYLAITDHSKSEFQANGMTIERFNAYVKELTELKNKSKNIRLLIGSEVDILEDGSLDYSNKELSKLDIVIASIHSKFNMDKESMTKRIIKAFDTKKINIFAHPTSRRIGYRDPIEFDFEKVCISAKKNNVILEINSNPSRLDLNDVLIRRAKELGCKFIINTDSHHTSHFDFIEYGIGQARRGWLEEKDVINTLSFKDFMKEIRKK